jgi:hypothetical protein
MFVMVVAWGIMSIDDKLNPADKEIARILNILLTAIRAERIDVSEPKLTPVMLQA